MDVSCGRVPLPSFPCWCFLRKRDLEHEKILANMRFTKPAARVFFFSWAVSSPPPCETVLHNTTPSQTQIHTRATLEPPQRRGKKKRIVTLDLWSLFLSVYFFVFVERTVYRLCRKQLWVNNIRRNKKTWRWRALRVSTVQRRLFLYLMITGKKGWHRDVFFFFVLYGFLFFRFFSSSPVSTTLCRLMLPVRVNRRL